MWRATFPGAGFRCPLLPTKIQTCSCQRLQRQAPTVDYVEPEEEGVLVIVRLLSAEPQYRL